MADTISIAAGPDETEPHGAAESLPIYPKPANNAITSEASNDESYGLLGTPQERLGIIRTETRNAIAAGMPLKFDFVQLATGGNALVIVISGGNACAACGWWNLQLECANEVCPTKSQIESVP